MAAKLTCDRCSTLFVGAESGTNKYQSLDPEVEGGETLSLPTSAVVPRVIWYTAEVLDSAIRSCTSTLVGWEKKCLC